MFYTTSPGSPAPSQEIVESCRHSVVPRGAPPAGGPVRHAYSTDVAPWPPRRCPENGPEPRCPQPGAISGDATFPGILVPMQRDDTAQLAQNLSLLLVDAAKREEFSTKLNGAIHAFNPEDYAVRLVLPCEPRAS